MSVKEIEAAIEQLPASDVAELVSWLVDYHAKSWDQEIEADLDAGRLDAFLANVDSQYRAGLAKPL